MGINIAYSSSDAYAKCTGISMLSLLQSNKDIEKITIYVFNTDISELNKNHLCNIAKQYGREIILIDIHKQMERIAGKFDFTSMRGSYNTYVRLFASTWLKDIERVLFIDSDTLVVGPISDLFSTNMNEKLIAAVPDVGVYGRYSCVDDIEIVNRCEKYINAGIMLLNLSLWKSEKTSELIALKIAEYKKEWCCSEQSIINYCINDRCQYVHLKYNYYTPFHYQNFSQINAQYCLDRLFTKEEYEEARSAPVIIHFIGSPYDRPWYLKSVSPFRGTYMEYYFQSPWKDVPLETFPQNTQIGYKIYDEILYRMRKHRFYKLYYFFRVLIGQKLKKYLIGIMGRRI